MRSQRTDRKLCFMLIHFNHDRKADLPFNGIGYTAVPYNTDETALSLVGFGVICKTGRLLTGGAVVVNHLSVVGLTLPRVTEFTLR